jgi:hypothetical protein
MPEPVFYILFGTGLLMVWIIFRRHKQELPSVEQWHWDMVSARFPQTNPR